ncbi:MAG: hypothetical protein HY796_04915 [Elusimicrobia bacterium]|nr:hypothetical protein [Elusimicrobiota bacterium]
MKDNNPVKDWLNEIIYRLSRPYILVLALIFTLIPSGKLTEALESGAEFLKIDTDAKAVAMGSAYTAIASGIDAIHYNPSGMAALNRVEAGFSHTNWLLGSSHDFIGIAMPVSQGIGDRVEGRVKNTGMVMGLGFTRLTNGAMEGRASDRGRTGGFNAYDQSIALGAAKNFGHYALGGSVKYIQSAIAGSRASAFAVDIGAGRKLTGLPVYAAHNFMPGFALRTGYMMNATAGSVATCAGGFSAGVGLYFLNTGLDYSMSPFGELGNVQKLSVKKKF